MGNESQSQTHHPLFLKKYLKLNNHTSSNTSLDTGFPYHLGGMPKPRASSRLSLGIARGPVLISLSTAVNFRFHFFLHTLFSLGAPCLYFVRRSSGRFLGRKLSWSLLEWYKPHRIIVIAVIVDPPTTERRRRRQSAAPAGATDAP